MSKKVLFVGRKDDRVEFDTSWSMAKQLQNSASGFVYVSCDIEDLVFSYDGKKLAIVDRISGKDVDEYDGIFLLGWFKHRIHEDVVMALARYAEARAIPLLNSEALHCRSRSKLSQYVIAALYNLHATPFVFCCDPGLSAQMLHNAGIDYPCVVKSVTASRGRDNYVVNSDQELVDTLQNQSDQSFVIQPFIPNDGDYRLLVMGDRVRLALHRKAQTGSHLNNTSQGGIATLVDPKTLDPHMLADSVRIAQLLRREVTGVDMIVHRDTGEYYLLEANNMPQLSTGSMVPEKMHALDNYIVDWLKFSGK